MKSERGLPKAALGATCSQRKVTQKSCAIAKTNSLLRNTAFGSNSTSTKICARSQEFQGNLPTQKSWEM